jgi:hypothetical protein
MFCWACGSTSREEPYGLVDQPVNLGLGLHEPTGIHEVSTFDRKKNSGWQIKIKPRSPSFCEPLAPLVVNFCFTPQMSRSVVPIILPMFCLARGSTFRDKLHGLPDQTIHPGRGLYELISIREVSTRDTKKNMFRLQVKPGSRSCGATLGPRLPNCGHENRVCYEGDRQGQGKTKESSRESPAFGLPIIGKHSPRRFDFF